MCGPNHKVLNQQHRPVSRSNRKGVTLQRHATLPGPLRSLPISTHKVKKNTLQHNKKNPYVGWFRHAPPRQPRRVHCFLKGQPKKQQQLVQFVAHRHHMHRGYWYQERGLLRGGTTIWSDKVPQDVVLSDAEDTDGGETLDDDEYTYADDDDASIRSDTRLDLMYGVDAPRLEYNITQMDIIRMNRVASRHLDVESIANLPVVTYTGRPLSKNKKTSESKAFSWMLVHSDSETSDDEQTTEQEEEHPLCIICCDAFVPGDRLRVLPCSHSFHTGCIDRWLSGSHSSFDCFTAGCPTCKKSIPTQSYCRVGDALSHSFVS